MTLMIGMASKIMLPVILGTWTTFEGFKLVIARLGVAAQLLGAHRLHLFFDLRRG